MAPILIDNRGLIKLGIISLLTLLIVFSAGYFSGYQRAAAFYATTSEIETLALPEQNTMHENSAEPMLPEGIIAGEEIDVDQPAVTSSGKAQGQNSEISKAINKLSESDAVVDAKKIDTKVLENKSLSDPTVKVTQKGISENNDDVDPAIVTTLGKKQKIEISSLTTDELNEIKYSVQVGVYGNLVNAENMVKMLQVQSFDAYVTDYKNKKNVTRYNVRFGYFVNKKAALAALRRYKNDEKGDGYLVKFSVENIVNLADKNSIGDDVDPAAPIEIINESKSLDITTTKADSSDIAQDKILSKFQSEEQITN